MLVAICMSIHYIERMEQIITQQLNSERREVCQVSVLMQVLTDLLTRFQDRLVSQCHTHAMTAGFQTPGHIYNHRETSEDIYDA